MSRYNTAVNAGSASSSATVSPSDYTLRQRLLLWLISWAGFIVIRLIGPTLRYNVSFEEGAPESDRVQPVVWAFWHQCIITAAWHWRNRRIAVMTSRSFDGEYIARIVEKFGYTAVRGSSTRGAVSALLGMRRELACRRSVAFTIDGPQGPRYVAKPGPLLLARATGVPLCAFHLAVERAWALPTWDRLIIPKPFSRVLLRFSRQIMVPANCDGAELERLHSQMQDALDRARDYAEARLRQGTAAATACAGD